MFRGSEIISRVSIYERQDGDFEVYSIGLYCHLTSHLDYILVFVFVYSSVWKVV